jgi:hypothetical protein
MSISLSKTNMNTEKEKENENETKEQNEQNEQKGPSIELQLGDVIRIKDPTNEMLNDHIFFIDYIDADKIKLIDESDLQAIQLRINNGILANGTITEIELLSRNDSLGYAKQNGLYPGEWINLYFGGDLPVLITGEITNLEEDMIEIQTYPEGECFSRQYHSLFSISPRDYLIFLNLSNSPNITREYAADYETNNIHDTA